MNLLVVVATAAEAQRLDVGATKPLAKVGFGRGATLPCDPLGPPRIPAFADLQSCEAEQGEYEQTDLECLGGFCKRSTVVVSGVGPVAAALATAAALGQQSYDLVVSAGIGGAYAGGGLRPGDLAVSSVVIQADIGAWDAEQFLPLSALGLGSETFSVWHGARDLSRQLGAGFGPCLTLGSVTGSAQQAAQLEARYPGAICEGMEGAGVAHAALQAGVPMLELRGISNMVGPRERERWQLGAALEAAKRGLAALAGV